MRSVLASPPAQEPVSLQEANSWLKADGEDALVLSLVATARQAAEDYTGRAFVTQTWRQTVSPVGRSGVPGWLPAGSYDLPYNFFDSPLPESVELLRRPVQSVASVGSFAPDGTPAIYPPTGYRLSGDALVFAAGWPSPLRAYDSADITYVAGYGDPSQVPAPIKTAILLAAQSLYGGRAAGAPCSTELGDVPAGVKTLKAGDSTITRFGPGESGSAGGRGVLPAAALALLAPYKTYRL